MANDRFIGVGFKGAPTPAATVNDQVIHGNLALNQYPPGGFEISEWLVCSCLLYTSPSPRDLSTSRMPSSA